MHNGLISSRNSDVIIILQDRIIHDKSFLRVDL